MIMDMTYLALIAIPLLVVVTFIIKTQDNLDQAKKELDKAKEITAERLPRLDENTGRMTITKSQGGSGGAGGPGVSVPIKQNVIYVVRSKEDTEDEDIL